MTNTEIFQKIRESISALLRISENDIYLHSRLNEELQVDSLFMAQVVIAVEEEFDLILDETELPKFVTINDIVTYIGNELERK